jgi:hypothetical protein
MRNSFPDRKRGWESNINLDTMGAITMSYLNPTLVHLARRKRDTILAL